MSDCPANEQLDAFYDGELDAAQMAVIRAHLSQCDSCRQRLAQCAEMSRLFTGAPQPRLLPISNMRLHNAIDAAMENGLVRIAWMVSAIAACMLIAGSFWLIQFQSRQTQPADSVASSTPPWATVATSADADVLQQDEATPIARWYLASVGPKSEDLP